MARYRTRSWAPVARTATRCCFPRGTAARLLSSPGSSTICEELMSRGEIGQEVTTTSPEFDFGIVKSDDLLLRAGHRPARTQRR